MATSTRNATASRQNRIKPGELVPVADRIQWMLGCRAALAIAVLVLWWLNADPHGAPSTWLWWAIGWPVGTALTLLAPSRGRRVARASLTGTLLGDGVLLGVAGWALGQLEGPVGFLIVLHAVAVTLLASFRTGVRVAVWHCLVNMLFFNAIDLGLLAHSGSASRSTSWMYLAAMWAAVLGVAALAAMNERELRRRRHDSEALRQFGLKMSTTADAAAIAGALAEFAYRELPARKAAVLTYVGGPTDEDAAYSVGAVVDQDTTTLFHHLGADAEPGSGSVVRRAAVDGPVLTERLDQRADRWLATAMPDARHVVVLPFNLTDVLGALVVEVRSTRLERRIMEIAEQAVQHAAIALDRNMLTDRMRAASETDGLTGVANRRRFDEVLRAELHNATNGGTGLALAMVDIDHFKRLNDMYGHQTGDDVLRQVAAAIRQAAGDLYVVARYGGEEFAVIMPGADAETAYAAAERIRSHISATATLTQVTASVGLASCPAHGTDSEAIIAAADAALYSSKQQGRNQVTVAGHDRRFARVSEAV